MGIGRRLLGVLGVLVSACLLLIGSGLVSVTRPAASAGAPTGAGAATCRPWCRGSLAGAGFLVEVPPQWHGTLLLWSHGWRTVGTPRTAVDAPDRETARLLLASGYALAGSSYRTEGWAVATAMGDDQALLSEVQRRVRPRRVLAWGDSMGGLVTSLLAARDPRIAGSAPACATLGGTRRKLDADQAALSALRRLDPPLPASPATWRGVVPWTATTRAALTGLPDAAVAHLAAMVGANPSATVTDPAWARRVLTRAVGSAAALGVEDQPRAVAAAESLEAGAVADLPRGPVVTLHGELDPQVPLAHERAYADRLAAAGSGAALLSLVVPGDRTHCGFRPAVRVGQLRVLEAAVASGAAPALDPALRDLDVRAGAELPRGLPPWPALPPQG